MSLINCKECGQQISKSAKACPHCGAKVKRTGIFTWIVAGFFALMFLGMIVGTCDEKNRSDEEASKAAAEQTRIAALTPEQKAAEEKRKAEEAAAQEEITAQRLGLRWGYNESEDKMGRGTIRIAYVKSLNELSFDFPYQGSQRAELQLRSHPKYGKDVILSIQKGQFLCNGYDGCNVSVRFDNGKPQTYRASEPSDHSTTVLFLNNYDRFLSKARKAKKAYIEAQFFQEGARVFEFDIAGLKW